MQRRRPKTRADEQDVFSSKKKREEEKRKNNKVRQKEEFQKEATKNLHSPRKNAKRMNEKIIFRKERKLFPQTI